jgi:hypothetical protein
MFRLGTELASSAALDHTVRLIPAGRGVLRAAVVALTESDPPDTVSGNFTPSPRFPA